MKLLNPKGILATLALLAVTVSFGQQATARIAMYPSLPARINIEQATLANALTYNRGNDAVISLSTSLVFAGQVIFKNDAQANLQSVAIKSTGGNNAVLHINKITNADNTITYTGRILNPNAADGYLIKNEIGVYVLQKFESSTLLDPCEL